MSLVDRLVIEGVEVVAGEIASGEGLSAAGRLFREAMETVPAADAARWAEIRKAAIDWWQTDFKTEVGLGLDHKGNPYHWTQFRLNPSKELILDGSESFARKLTGLQPQNLGGRLNYYLTGSLSTNALARAGEYTMLDAASLPEIVPGRTIRFGVQGKQSLFDAVRQISDIDVVELKPGGFGKGGGPRFHELADRDLAIFKDLRLGDGAYLHRIESAEHQIASVKLGDTTVFIQEPVSHAARKMSLLTDTTSPARAAKYLTDYSILSRALAEAF